MHYYFAILCLFILALPALSQDKVVLVLHGGAGGTSRKNMSAERETLIRATLSNALKAGLGASDKGGSLDAIETAIKVLEDSAVFNAGKGAVFNREGRQELNSSIMDGKTKMAGAVAGINRVKNPISAARLIMEKSEHVFMIGEAAERFCRDQNAMMVSPLYFWTEDAWKQLQYAEKSAKQKKTSQIDNEPLHFGTVGAVALDRSGNLAAGTSTGGITYVRPGRVGDSPIIGAGTYAKNASCAVSCTGKGELFIRHTVAVDIAARMKYRGDPLGKAAQDALDGLPKIAGGAGGLIAIDRNGNVAMPYNTANMVRGAITQSGKITIAIFAE